MKRGVPAGRWRGFAALLFLLASTAAAQAWSELPYNPPVGSKWNVQRDLFTDESIVEGGQKFVRRSTLKITSELTIEAKTPFGFIVSYARRASSYEGHGTDDATTRASLAALENIVIRVATDATGRPMRVENLDDIRAGLRKMIDVLAGAAKDAKTAAVARQLLAGMLKVNPSQAAELYTDDIQTLALGQNTGLKAGEVRRATESKPNSIGLPMVVNKTLAIDKTDEASGRVTYVETESYDPESIRRFLLEIVRRSGDKGQDVDQMKLALDSRLEIDVDGGMTRALRRTSTTSSEGPKLSRVVVSRKEVTVTPAR